MSNSQLNCSIPPYSIIYHQKKGISINVNENGQYMVYANQSYTEDKIQLYVEKYWHQHQTCEIPQFVCLFGKNFKIKKMKGKTHHVSTCDDLLMIQYTDQCDAKQTYDRFIKHYRREVFDDIKEMLYLRFPSHFETMPTLRIRKLKKNWGICHPQKNTITINSELMEYPIDFIEYVICYEMIQLLEFSTSSNFYSLFHEIMPDYERRKSLISQEIYGKYAF